LSVSSLVTIAVEDMASAPPTAKAACQDKFTTRMPTAMVLSVDTMTWVTPMPKTILRIAMRRGIDTSSPIVNNRKTTPISAICSMT
jgi:hypothetical protein